MPRRELGVILAALCLLATSCGGEPRPAAVAGNDQKVLPSETLQDWVTYGDRLVVVEATAESASPISEGERESGEGYSSRQVSMKIITTHWSSPETDRTRELETPTELTTANGGSVVKGKTRKPVRFDGETYATVGQPYLALLTYSSIALTVDPQTRAVTRFEKPSWTIGALVPLEDGLVAPADDPDGEDSPVRAKLAALTPEASGELLGKTEPDPAASEYAALDPVARYQNVVLDTGSTPAPGPAEQG